MRRASPYAAQKSAAVRRPVINGGAVEVFNLFVHGGEDAWETHTCVLDRSRVGEYTDEPHRARMQRLDPATLVDLRSLPSLFAYESHFKRAARVGWLTSIKARGQDVQVKFEFDDAIVPIAPEELSELAWDLDIASGEFSRTHWALKEPDLLAVLGASSSDSESTAPPYRSLPGELSFRDGVPPRLAAYFRQRDLDLMEQIGDGGLGQVIRAKHMVLRSERAVKFFNPRFYAGDEKNRLRFVREAEVLGKFAHPRIVRFYDAGVAYGVPFIVADFVPGEDLERQVRARGRFQADEVRSIMVQVLDALEVAHAAGVFHRDIKPRNIMWTQGEATVLDFGASGVIEAKIETRMTTSPQGTPGYIDPELLNNPQLLDPRVDLYSLAVTAHTLLTGRLPDPRDIAQYLAGLDTPADLVDILSRATTRFDERLRTANEMREALLRASPTRTPAEPGVTHVDAPKGEAFLVSDEDLRLLLGIPRGQHLPPEWAQWLHAELTRPLTGDIGAICADAALRAVAILLEVGRLNGPDLAWVEGEDGTRVAGNLVGLLTSLGNIDELPRLVEMGFRDCVRRGWLTMDEYDAWRPGMASGSGIREQYATTPLGKRTLTLRGLVPPPKVSGA